MQRSPDESSAVIREHWLAEVVGATQQLALRSVAVETDDVRAMLIQFIDNIPRAATHVERLVLRGLLLDVAFQFGHAVHRRVHSGRREACGFVPATVLDQFWQRPRDPDAAFRRWIDAFMAEFTGAHPPTVAGRAARLVRVHYEERWSVGQLARY